MAFPTRDFFRVEFDDLSRELGGLRTMLRDITVRLRNVETRGKLVAFADASLFVTALIVRFLLTILFSFLVEQITEGNNVSERPPAFEGTYISAETRARMSGERTSVTNVYVLFSYRCHQRSLKFFRIVSRFADN